MSKFSSREPCWSLKNLSDFLNIEEKRLKKIALESFDVQICRQQYAFLSMEVLIRLFVNGQKCADIEEEFKSILLK